MNTIRTIENPRGNGDIYNKDNKIATLNYRLSVQQEIAVVQTGGKTEEIEGLKRIAGSLNAGEHWAKCWTKDKLTLRLQDGRKIDFFAQHVDGSSGVVRIVGDGVFY